MADRSILYRLRAALQGGFVAVAHEVQVVRTYAGLLAGSADVETGLIRLDATGIGAAIFRFTGSYSAQNSNINEWFGGRQLTRLRCTDSGLGPAITGSVNLDLPGTLALNTAFDQLVTDGLPEIIRFVIEYTGPSKDFLRVQPRAAGSGPQITGTTSIIIRSGIAAEIEVTRASGVVSDYTFLSIGGIGDGSTSNADSLKLINPSVQNWDASASGVLPTQVVKGNAYKVVNAPTDGSGRFGEVMQNNDWVVWEGETFTSWSAEPHLWFVVPAHDVRRITALESDFLTDTQITPQSDRNTIVRGEDYATDAAHGEIRLKIYATKGDYDAADLNTTGDIDVYTDASDQTGFLAIRLDGTAATLADVLPTLYVYVEDGSGNFTRLGNLSTDFTHEGDFGSESDYLAISSIDYTKNDSIRVYIGSVIDRYNNPNLDVFEPNLSAALQAKINSREAWASIAEVLFSGATVRDIHVADRVEYDTGYSRGIDWRDMANSTTINANRYIDSDLTITANNAAFTITGFGPNIQKVVGIELQRNDAQTGDGAMMEMGSLQPFIRVNTSNQIQVNTTVGNGESWSSLGDSTGAVTLGSVDNFLAFELLPQPTSSNPDQWEIVVAFYDGTNYKQLNNITFTPSGVANGDNLGFSRSSVQRGEVLSFKAILSPGYLTHSQLSGLIRQHRVDKWDFGFARLIEGSDAKEVVLTTELVTPVKQDVGAPTDTPDFIGQHYIDTTNKKVYFAIGTTNSGDWEIVN